MTCKVIINSKKWNQTKIYEFNLSFTITQNYSNHTKYISLHQTIDLKEFLYRKPIKEFCGLCLPILRHGGT